MLFISRELRDQTAKELTANGKEVIKTTITNQQLHPMYVKDWPYELTQAEKGLGNTLYKTFFDKLYSLEVR